MKKIILLFLCILLLTGCGKYSDKDIIKDLDKKINKSSGYILDGKLEILNNDEVYNYNINVTFSDSKYYRIGKIVISS